jgi:hypothetical protein
LDGVYRFDECGRIAASQYCSPPPCPLHADAPLSGSTVRSRRCRDLVDLRGRGRERPRELTATAWLAVGDRPAPAGEPLVLARVGQRVDDVAAHRDVGRRGVLVDKLPSGQRRAEVPADRHVGCVVASARRSTRSRTAPLIGGPSPTSPAGCTRGVRRFIADHPHQRVAIECCHMNAPVITGRTRPSVSNLSGIERTVRVAPLCPHLVVGTDHIDLDGPPLKWCAPQR